jgi:hypothetical protein
MSNCKGTCGNNFFKPSFEDLYPITTPVNSAPFSSVDHVVLQTTEAAVAKVTVKLLGRTVVGMGESKKHPTDDNDAVVGYELALARALSDAALQIVGM